MADEAKPTLIVVHLQWTELGLSRQEAYGPWTAVGDGSHISKIRDFFADFQRLTGRIIKVATISIVVDPAAWVQEQADKAALDQAYIDQGIATAEEIGAMRAGQESSNGG